MPRPAEQKKENIHNLQAKFDELFSRQQQNDLSTIPWGVPAQTVCIVALEITFWFTERISYHS